MTPRERVRRALLMQPVDRAPRDITCVPGIPWYRGDEWREMLARFPIDFGGPSASYGQGKRCRGVRAEVGYYTDAWGCVWHVGEPGIIGEVKECPLADWSALSTYQPPFELLDEADLSNVNKSCAESDHFIRTGTETRPFERMQFLRGSEALFLDLAYGTREVDALIRMLHDFFCREMEMWANTDIDAVYFMDDWGSQTALLISPDMWRGIFKPLYQDYCNILHSKGKFVFFHSDGYILPIFSDLIEVGMDAINAQISCMGIEKLGAQFAGKVTFWGDIDRQHTLPFGTEEDVRAEVRRIRAALDHGNGGVIARCCWETGVPAENIAAAYDEWDN